MPKHGGVNGNFQGELMSDAEAARRQSGRMTRQLRMLRAHGLIAKIQKTHRYQLTTRGHASIAVLLEAQQASVEKLQQLAA